MRRLILLLAIGSLLLATLPASGGPPSAHVDQALREADAPRSTIVSFDDRPSPATISALERLGTVHHVYTFIDAAHVTLPGARVAEAADLPAVTRIDADEALAWHLDTSRPAVQVGPRLWSQGFTGSSATIAVVDTGIDETHPSVQGRVQQAVVFTGQSSGPVETSASTDEDGHGTHVAGITAGDGSGSTLTNPDDARYAGVAPASPLVSIDISASFTTSTAIRAFEWIHDNHETYGIEVVQNSWGRKEVGQPYEPDDPAIRASNALVLDDLVVVFSAANEGPAASSLSMEAMNPNVITVAATDDQGEVAPFSSRGPVLLENGSEASWVKPDVAAPGVRIKSAAAGQQREATSAYTQLSGTSQAAPHVSGIAAMIRDQVPDLPAADVMAAIEAGTLDVGPPGPDAETGHGFVIAPRALDAALKAANESLAKRTETYASSGRIVAGTLTSDLLSDDSGVDDGRANGSFPVKRQAQNLSFSFTWTSTQASLPAPQLDVRLTDPQGNDVLVPTDDRQASRTISGPVPGTWTWEAVPASSTEAGAAEYEMNATVTLSSIPGLAETGAGDQGGFFDAGPADQIQQAWDDARERFGDEGAIALAGAVALAMVLVLVAVVRLF